MRHTLIAFNLIGLTHHLNVISVTNESRVYTQTRAYYLCLCFEIFVYSFCEHFVCVVQYISHTF